jgi:outer membrane receptor protein involved in Fe transport
MGRRLRGQAASLCALILAMTAGEARSAAQQTADPPAASPAEQPAAAPESEPKEPAIVITGSRIPRRNLTAVSPVNVVAGEDFKLEGAVLTEELINQLPQVVPDQGALLSNGSSGTATVNMRGLGASRTLVLVNGRRLLPGDPTYPAGDINIIPSSLIQRVEVLTGGASSVYGSDAVSGVINFILDTKLEGLRIDGQASFYQHQNRDEAGVTPLLDDAGNPFPTGNQVNGANRDINAAFGHGFLGGRGHVTVYAGYRRLSAIAQDVRDYSACTISSFSPDPDDVICGGSSTSANGSFGMNFGVLHIGPDQTFVPGRTVYNPAPTNYYQRPGRRYTAGAFADLELSEALRPYFELMYMDDRTVAQLAPSGDFANTETINCDNPLLSDQQRSLVCFEGNFVGETPVFDNDGNLVRIDDAPIPFIDPVTGATYFQGVLFVGRRNVEGGPRQDDRRHRDLRIVGGLKGHIARGVDYDASYLFGRVKFADAFTNEVSVSHITRALDVVSDPTTGEPVCRSVLTGEDPDCVPWNVFALGGVTPEAAAYIVLPATQSADVEQKIGNASATLELGEWGIRSPWSDEGPAMNLGAEYRRDTLDFRPDAAFQSGDLAGQGQPVIPFAGGTTAREVFAEARVPLISGRLIESLAIEGGYRQSWHSDGQNSFATSSDKLALELSPVRGLRFRASRQRAVRAPNIQELFAPIFPSLFFTDPCAGISPDATQEQCALTGVTAAQYGFVPKNPRNDEGYASIVGGNAQLGPESATTKAIGVVLEPRFIPGFNATVDWFDIDLTDAVAVIGAQTIINTCLATGDPLFCERIHRDPKGSLRPASEGFVDDTNANIGALNVRGIDIGANYRRNFGRFGSATLEFLGSRLRKWDVDNGGLATPYDCAGLFGMTCGVALPRWRHTARLTWTRNPVSLSLNWRFIGRSAIDASRPGVTPFLFFNPAFAKIGARSYFDLTGIFRIDRSYVMRLGVRNIFDRDPPIVGSGSSGACLTGCNGNTYPQLYDPLGRYVFASFTVDLHPF